MDMKVPNFDDVDLGIVAIALIVLAAIVIIGLKADDAVGLKEGLAFIAVGVTAISTLAGRREKPQSKEAITMLLQQADEIKRLESGLLVPLPQEDPATGDTEQPKPQK